MSVKKEKKPLGQDIAEKIAVSAGIDPKNVEFVQYPGKTFRSAHVPVPAFGAVDVVEHNDGNIVLTANISTYSADAVNNFIRAVRDAEKKS